MGFAFALISISLFLVNTIALKCEFYASDLAPTAEAASAQQNDSILVKEYECQKEDKHCVLLGGVLNTQPKIQWFELRSCESDVKRYMDPISAKVGQPLDYACQNIDGKNRTVGALTYWYNCCTLDDCNSAALPSLKIVGSGLLLLAVIAVQASSVAELWH